MTDTAVQLTIRALAALALLTACSTSTNQTSTGHSSTPTKPSTNMTTGAVVQVPPEATPHTEAGARAFADFYLRTADSALVSADSSALSAISSPQCQGCRVFRQWADDLRAAGHHHATRSLTLSGQLVRPASTGDVVVIDLLVDESATAVVDARGTKVGSEPAQRATLRTTVVWGPDGWKIVESLLVKG